MRLVDSALIGECEEEDLVVGIGEVICECGMVVGGA